MKPKLLFSLLLLPFGAVCQDFSFQIVKQGSVYSQEKVDQAFSKSNFCGRINPHKDYIIKMDDGTEVNIISSDNSKVAIKSECVRANDLMEENSIWSIAPNGTLLKQSTIKPIKPGKNHE